MNMQKVKGRKLIKCPYCREYLIDVAPTTLVRVFCASKGKLKPIEGQTSKQCPACKGKVGLVMTESQGG